MPLFPTPKGLHKLVSKKAGPPPKKKRLNKQIENTIPYQKRLPLPTFRKPLVARRLPCLARAPARWLWSWNLTSWGPRRRSLQIDPQGSVDRADLLDTGAKGKSRKFCCPILTQQVRAGQNGHLSECLTLCWVPSKHGRSTCLVLTRWVDAHASCHFWEPEVVFRSIPSTSLGTVPDAHGVCSLNLQHGDDSSSSRLQRSQLSRPILVSGPDCWGMHPELLRGAASETVISRGITTGLCWVTMIHVVLCCGRAASRNPEKCQPSTGKLDMAEREVAANPASHLRGWISFPAPSKGCSGQ